MFPILASGYEVKRLLLDLPLQHGVVQITVEKMKATTLYNAERATVADLKPYVVEIESEGLESLVDIVRKAESQSTDYKAEIISELKAEYEAENVVLFLNTQNLWQLPLLLCWA